MSIIGTITILLNVVVDILDVISVVCINIRNLSDIGGGVRNGCRHIVIIRIVDAVISVNIVVCEI